MNIRRAAGELFVNTALVLASASLFLGGMEVFLRFFAPQVANVAVATAKDPELGYTLKKNWPSDPSQRGLAWTNSWGMRDSERDFSLPLTRILGLGDSQTFGLGVGQHEGYLFQLERCMNEARPSTELPAPIEVINSGVSGYSTTQELLFLKRLFPLVRPRLVLLGYFAGNDIDETLDQGLCSLSSSGELELSQSGWDSKNQRAAPVRKLWLLRLKRWLYTHCHTYVFLANRIKATPLLARPLLALGMIERLPSDRLYVTPPSERYEYGYRITEALMEKMRKMCRNHHASFLVVLIPSREQVYSARFRYLYDLYHPSIPPDWAYPHRRLSSICQRRNIQVIDLLPILTEAAKENADLYLSEGHLSEEGHGVIAAALCDHLKDNLKILAPE